VGGDRNAVFIFNHLIFVDSDKKMRKIGADPFY